MRNNWNYSDTTNKYIKHNRTVDVFKTELFVWLQTTFSHKYRCSVTKIYIPVFYHSVSYIQIYSQAMWDN